MIVTNRYLKYYYNASKWIHIILGSVILFITLSIGGIIALRNLSWEIYKNLHNLMGIAVLFYVVIVFIAGLLAKYKMENLSWSTKSLLRFIKFHKVIGRVLVLFC